ncbi:phosphoenolpyruvate carboxykinase (GTP) [Chloroflexota bacterium]
MDRESGNILQNRLGEKDYEKLSKIDNPKLHRFIADYLELCNPARVFVSADSPEDIQYIRQAAIRDGGETVLATKGHTVHFDGYYDQARDKAKTKFLIPRGVSLGPEINAADRDEGLRELKQILKNIVQGRELYVCFFCLGPTNSDFAIPCVQLTDSSYVAHSETLLYRPGYEEFKRLGQSERFFKFVHSQGDVQTVGLGLKVSKNIDKRRVYIDLEEETVYSTNTQYAGNTVGLKKLALRLAINRALKEGWLAEHMLLMGVHGPKDRVCYFLGAFPSMCGKTSTALLDGESVVGDDIAYLRRKGEEVRAVNVESGIFGIIRDVNSHDDPLIWRALNKPGEVIFSNVLVTPKKGVYWIGKDGVVPEGGINHSGEWVKGKKDEQGNEVTPSHQNARYTFSLTHLDNTDPRLHHPDGFVVSGIIYGGRDSDTWVPVEESFDWASGIIAKGASLESETTAATLGKEGVRTFNPMSNLDFVSVSIGQYVESNLEFGAGLKNPPLIFSVNYFLKGAGGDYLNGKNAKQVWLKWMELRANGEAEAIKTPTGLIPRYQDLKRLFKTALGEDYPEEDYIKQFTIRIPENLAKIDRLVKIYQTRITDTPPIVFKVLAEQWQRLVEAREKYGDYIPPAALA